MRSRQDCIREDLDADTLYRRLLYRRGYLITTRCDIDKNAYPFYGNWNSWHINDEFYAYVHADQHFYMQEQGDVCAILIGHAYNPFSGEIDENQILQRCIEEYTSSDSRLFDYISELTGIHVIGIFGGGKALFVQDCTAMEGCYYGSCGGNLYILSHPRLLGGIDTPTNNWFVSRLTQSHSYNHWGSKYLPGDVTIYNELKRLGPNVSLSLEGSAFSIARFYPTHPHPEVPETDIDTAIEIARLIKTSVKLCAEKWDRPAISLSGGMDSRTTLAASNGCYDRFQYYSFYCKPQEKDDAEAAAAICSSIGIEHRTYPITESNDDVPKFDLFKRVIAQNMGGIHTPADHELRKFYFLSRLDDFDVELKSWASEIGRAYWEKRYGFSLPTKLTPRDFSIFQTRFVGAPLLLALNDRANKAYLKASNLENPPFNYEHTDMFYWEYRFGSNGTIVNMLQQVFNFDVTMPMNCRKMMDMFLWYPHEFRKADGVNTATIQINEPKLANIHFDVHNGYFSKRRVQLEGLYYRLMKLPKIARR